MILIDGTTSIVQKEVIDILSEIAGISFLDIENALAKVGNCPGSNPPLMYVISKLAMDRKISSILEFGSGATTILFSFLKQKYGIKYISLENKKEWYDVTKNACNILEIESSSLYLQEEFFNKKQSALSSEVISILNKNNCLIDLVFIDSCPKETRENSLNIVLKMATKKNNKLFHKNTIIMIDDCESKEEEEYIRSIAHTGKVFLSHTRGIYTIDNLNKIDFVNYR